MSESVPNNCSSIGDMSPTFPYSYYPTASAGEPITFYVGPPTAPTRFDVHQALLSTNSPLFNTLNGLLRIITRPINLPTTDPIAFHAICTWLYEREPPVVTKEEELLLLMELWVALGKLGIYDKMNTIMRLGMALMQPKEFKCEIETVRWVYNHTHKKSKLRRYIVAIFCQRGPDVTTELFASANVKLSIFRDAVKFFNILNKVRAGNPKGIDDYELPTRFAMAHTYQPSELPNQPSQFFGTLVTGGEEVDQSKIEYPLPSFLIWGEKWQDLPDEHYFVTAEDKFREGGETLRQLKRMLNWHRE